MSLKLNKLHSCNNNKKSITYSLVFVSLITPSKSYVNQSLVVRKNFSDKKVVLKQSYILLT